MENQIKEKKKLEEAKAKATRKMYVSPSMPHEEP